MTHYLALANTGSQYDTTTLKHTQPTMDQHYVQFEHYKVFYT